MILPEEDTQLEQYDAKDFEGMVDFIPASPLCISRVYQHKEEAYSALDSRLVNQLEKNGLDKKVTQILEVLDEWRGCNRAKVWISDTLSADLNLPSKDEDPPAESTLQVFFIGEGLPSFVLTLYNLMKKCDDSNDQKEAIHDYTVSTIQDLKDSLLDFCSNRFTILPCTLDMDSLSAQSLEEELELREDEFQEFYDGPIRFTTKVFNSVTKAAVLLQGTTSVPYYMSSYPRADGTDEEWLLLMDQTWRNVAGLLIECLTHTNQSSRDIPCKAPWKMKVALLEAAVRVGRTEEVTIRSSSKQVNDCIEQLNVQENSRLRLETDDKSEHSFVVSSRCTTVTFTQNSEGVASVIVTTQQDMEMDETRDSKPIHKESGPTYAAVLSSGTESTAKAKQRDRIVASHCFKIIGIPEDIATNTAEKLTEVSGVCKEMYWRF